MRKRGFAILAGLVLLTSIGGALWSQTTQDVLKKMIEAQGGEKTLSALRDSTMTGTMEMIQMGMNGAQTTRNPRPMPRTAHRARSTPWSGSARP